MKERKRADSFSQYIVMQQCSMERFNFRLKVFTPLHSLTFLSTTCLLLPTLPVRSSDRLPHKTLHNTTVQLKLARDKTPRLQNNTRANQHASNWQLVVVVVNKGHLFLGWLGAVYSNGFAAIANAKLNVLGLLVITL